MSLKSIPGQERAKRFLQQTVRTGHVPHALLFSGMAGIGKMAVAREFAKLVNCLSPRELDCCDSCTSCRKMDGEHHPDLIWARADGAFIKLDQIRDLKQKVRYRPFEGKWRVTIIEDAQDLREEAGNALLKLLEEPPGQNIFLLTVLEPQMLLPTIVSRCCHVRFQPLESRWIEDHLIRTLQVAPDRAREVALLSEGSLQRAQWLFEEERISRWKELLENVIKLDRISMMDFFGLINQWVQKSEDLEQDLECIKLWVRDLILSRLIVEHSPVFQPDARVRRAIQRLGVETLFRLYNKIEQGMQHLRANANKQLTLEGVCLAIKDDLYGKGSWDSVP